jgi:hypothetical protein
MDSVRFGRALGIGARSAAKALAGAADAATAPNPAKPRTAAQPQRPAATTSVQPAAPGPIVSAVRTAAQATVQATSKADATRKGIARGSKRFGESVWGPFARLSSVLWLEITGSFFGIFALFAASAVWSHRADFRSGLRSTPANHDTRLHLLVFLAMAVVFTYFSVSSFVRAYRK